MLKEYAYYGDQITVENVLDLDNDGERIFAFACLEAGCLVFSQIAIGDSIIDFFIINPSRLRVDQSAGKLVEVTQHSRMAIHTPDRLTLEFTLSAILKQHQLSVMETSGCPHTILYNTEIDRLKAIGDDPAYRCSL